MTNKKIIQILESFKNYLCAGNPIWNTEGVKKAFDLAIEALEAQDTDRWIPCSERLPEEKDAGILKKLGTQRRSDSVIVTVDVKGERMTDLGYTHDGVWQWKMKYAFPDYKVIAWKPLPEPYKEEEHDK